MGSSLVPATCLALLAVVLAAPAVNAAEVQWLTDADVAWRASRTAQKPLLLFITKPNCKYCSLMKSKTYADRDLAAEINSSFIALTIDAQREQTFVKELEVTAFPTTLVITPDEKLVDWIKGYLPPGDMRRRLASPQLRSQTKRR